MSILRLLLSCFVISIINTKTYAKTNETSIFQELSGLKPISLENNLDYDFIEKFQNISLHRHKRQAIVGHMHQWTSRFIPYQIVGGDFNFQNRIRSALRMWESTTCIRFQENVRAQDGIRYVMNYGDACFTSYIGKNGGWQTIIIGAGCASQGEYLIAHETGHALGLFHTHQRPDRDLYVTVNYGNIRKEAIGSFIPFLPMLLGFGISQVDMRPYPYDYGSLMHYNAVGLSIRRPGFVMVPTDQKYLTTMGVWDVSFLDAQIINDHYCLNLCLGFTKLHCRNGGYQDPNNCRACRCPDGLGGVLCNQVQTSYCGGELQAGNQWFSIQNPFGQPYSRCVWRITNPSGGRIRFRIVDGNFPCSYGCKSYVEVKHKTDFRLTGFRSCCYHPREDIVSDGSQILVIFNPNGAMNARFTLNYIRQF